MVSVRFEEGTKVGGFSVKRSFLNTFYCPPKGAIHIYAKDWFEFSAIGAAVDDWPSIINATYAAYCDSYLKNKQILFNPDIHPFFDADKRLESLR